MISIIIPTYNEAKNIEPLMQRISSTLKGKKYEVIIVDDNSPDKTGLIARYLKDKYPLKIIIRKDKRDLSKSVLEGINIAKGDIMGVMDADLSHSPEDIPRLIEGLKEKDMVIGSKVIPGGKTEEWPLIRKMIATIGRIFAKPLVDVEDTMSGFFFFKKEVIDNIELNPVGYKIGLEIMVKGNHDGIKEVPIIFRNREIGKSKIGLKVYLSYISHLIELYRYKIFKEK